MTTDELLFFSPMPEALPLYELLRSKLLAAFPDTAVKAQKSQITFKARYGYAFVSLRRMKGCPPVFLILTFGLGRRVEGDEIFRAVEPYPGRWTHHVMLNRPEDLDGAVRAWLAEAYDFSQAKRRKKKGTSRPLPPSKEGD